MTRSRLHPFFLLFGCLLWTMCLSAQTLDTGILGTVTDPAGALVAGANVTITNTATGMQRVVKTSSDGNYEVRYLLPGDYTIQVQTPGFRTELRRRVVVQINQQARFDFAIANWRSSTDCGDHGRSAAAADRERDSRRGGQY